MQSTLDLKQDTKQLEGWLSVEGEWTLFPRSDFENYDPYVEEKLIPEEIRCVSLIDSTGSTDDDSWKWDGRNVIVAGHAVRYADLPIGSSTADRLLSKRYYKDQVVPNFCLRDLVFAATDIKVKR